MFFNKEDVSVEENVLYVQNATQYASKINALFVLNGVEVNEITPLRRDAETYFIEKME